VAPTTTTVAPTTTTVAPTTTTVAPTTTTVAPTTTTTPLNPFLQRLCAALQNLINRAVNPLIQRILILIFNALGCRRTP
jgi:hypothetical protein